MFAHHLNWFCHLHIELMSFNCTHTHTHGRLYSLGYMLPEMSPSNMVAPESSNRPCPMRIGFGYARMNQTIHPSVYMANSVTTNLANHIDRSETAISITTPNIVGTLNDIGTGTLALFQWIVPFTLRSSKSYLCMTRSCACSMLAQAWLNTTSPGL